MDRWSSRRDLRSRATLTVLVCFVVGLYVLHKYHIAFDTHGGVGWANPRRLRWSASYSRLLEDVKNQTLGFEKIFVITMPSRTDHRDMLALAGALTPGGGLQLDLVDGVDYMPSDYLLPPWGRADNETGPQLGADQVAPKWVKCWRAHMNVLRSIVERNLSTAIIAESDFDWDVNIKAQMQQFAKASSMLLHSDDRNALHSLDSTPSFSPPKTSAYGDLDRWDLLWLGHCGMAIPTLQSPTPKGRVTFQDTTVPERSYLHYFQYVNDRLLTNSYPDHTRMVHWAHRGMCQSAYAVTQQGARKMLYAMGVNRFYAPNDHMTRDLCDTGMGKVSPRANCISVQPPLFMNHRPAGLKRGFSDIALPEQDFNYVPITRNIRHSTKMNLDRLIAGRTDYVDQYPDSAPSS